MNAEKPPLGTVEGYMEKWGLERRDCPVAEFVEYVHKETGMVVAWIAAHVLVDTPWAEVVHLALKDRSWTAHGMHPAVEPRASDVVKAG